MTDLDELNLEIPVKPGKSPEKSVNWNIQPDPNDPNCIRDKHGNAFEFQAVICKFKSIFNNVGYEKK